MEEIAQVYARSLFEVASEQGKLDTVREQLGQFAEGPGSQVLVLRRGGLGCIARAFLRGPARIHICICSGRRLRLRLVTPPQ